MRNQLNASVSADLTADDERLVLFVQTQQGAQSAQRCGRSTAELGGLD